jgi:hypothetical protein
MIPKSLGEYEGVKKEQPDPFIGKTKEKCKWTHGITFKSASIGFIILLPLLLFIEEKLKTLNLFSMYIYLLIKTLMKLFLAYVSHWIIMKLNMKITFLIFWDLEITI